MNGFAASAIAISIPEKTPMSCFNETSVPSISTLTKSFGVFDQWHADVPGPTEPNRMYLFSATSHGATDDDKDALAVGYPQRTIFHNLQELNISYDVFFQDFPTVFFMRDMRYPPFLDHFHMMADLESHVEKGLLGTFTFLEPRYFSTESGYWASDQHPAHDVVEGEKLMAEVYEILRKGPQWNETALLITYDEHGGFFDHVPTPLNGIPNPDGIDGTNTPFNFTRLGVRVPAVMVSPWINEGTIFGKGVGPMNTSAYSHSSLSSTLRIMFDMDTPFLTKRDAWASTFENVFNGRSSPRTDCPMTVPTPKRGTMKPMKLKNIEHLQPLNALQKTFIAVVNDLSPNPLSQEQLDSILENESDGAEFMERIMQEHFRKYGLTL
jgi:phospholipase C